MASRLAGAGLVLLLCLFVSPTANAWVYSGSYQFSLVLDDGRYRFPAEYKLQVSRTQHISGQVKYPSMRCQATIPAQKLGGANITLQEQLESQRPLCIPRELSISFGEASSQPAGPEYLQLTPVGNESVAGLDTYSFKADRLSAFMINRQLTHPGKINANQPSLALDYITHAGLSDALASKLLDDLFQRAQQSADINSPWQDRLARDFTQHSGHPALVVKMFSAYSQSSYSRLLSFSQTMGSYLQQAEVEEALAELGNQLPELATIQERELQLGSQRYHPATGQLVVKLIRANAGSLGYWRQPVPESLSEEVQAALQNPELDLASAIVALQKPAAFVEDQNFQRARSEDDLSLWRAFTERYPNSANTAQANEAIHRLERIAAEERERRLAREKVREEARAAERARLEALERRRLAAYGQEKQVGQEVCQDFTAFFSRRVARGFVEQITGDRMQIRVHDTGTSANSKYREQGIYWDTTSQWRTCRY